MACSWYLGSAQTLTASLKDEATAPGLTDTEVTPRARRGVARLRMTTSSSLPATASQSITPPKRGRAPSGWRYSFACVLLRLSTHLGSASAASAMRSGTL